MKKDADFRVHCTQTILRLETDTDDSFKQLARLAYRKAESYHLLANEQYSNRDNRVVNYLGTVKAKIYDILRQSKRPTIICSTDA